MKNQQINNSILVLTSALDALNRVNKSQPLINGEQQDDTHANQIKIISKKIIKLTKKL